MLRYASCLIIVLSTFLFAGAQHVQISRDELISLTPELLVKGDVYVADQFGAKRNGPTIGDNVGNAIYAKTGNGIVYDGAIRDINLINY